MRMLENENKQDFLMNYRFYGAFYHTQCMQFLTFPIPSINEPLTLRTFLKSVIGNTMQAYCYKFKLRCYIKI